MFWGSTQEEKGNYDSIDMDPHQMVKQFYLALSVTTFEAKNDIWAPLFEDIIVPYLRRGDERLIRLQPTDETVAARVEMAKAGFHPILITVINGQPPQVLIRYPCERCPEGFTTGVTWTSIKFKHNSGLRRALQQPKT